MSYLPTATSEYRRQLRFHGPEAALRAITGDVVALPVAIDPYVDRRSVRDIRPVLAPPVDPWAGYPL